MNESYPVALRRIEDSPLRRIPRFANATELLSQPGLDVFCFCTPPLQRIDLVRAGVDAGVQLIAYEKPMSATMNEALEIRDRLRDAGIKSVVSHQHRYGAHYQDVKQIIERGEIGEIRTLYAHSVAPFGHLGTHLLDYMRWFNEGVEVEWVIAQMAGISNVDGSHPSPDYLVGTLRFANGAHGYLECGAGAPDVPEVDYWWRKNRIGALGTNGFAEVFTGGGWRCVTDDGLRSGGGKMDYEHDTAAYVADIAIWLDDPTAIHPCDGESAFKGFEVAMALLRSAAYGRQVGLPLNRGPSEIENLRTHVSAYPLRISLDESRKHYLP